MLYPLKAIISKKIRKDDAVIYMGPNVYLNVGSGSSITFNNCHVFGCGQMWIGITATGTGKVSVTNSMIEDMLMGIEINNPTLQLPVILNVTNSVFNRNTIALELSGCQTAGSLNQYFNIQNNVFTSRDINFQNWPNYPVNSWPSAIDFKGSIGVGDFEAPYATSNFLKALCKNGGQALTGIYLGTVGLTQGTTAQPIFHELQIGVAGTGQTFNLFDNLREGIMGVASNFSSVNNVFMEMHNIGGSSGGNGIIAFPPNNGTTTNHRVQIYTPQGSDQNKFYNCQTAVDVKGYREVIGQKSRFISNKLNGTPTNNGQFAYRIQSPDYLNIDITENRIFNYTTGIFVNITGSLVGKINVNKNVIAPADDNISITDRSVRQAINVENIFNCTGCSQQTTQVHTDYNTVRDVLLVIKCRLPHLHIIMSH
jgi:hypothetical protein